MRIIGIIGGIASGKTTVAQCIHNQGAGMICVDDIVHEVLEVPEVIDQMNTRWGRKFSFCCGAVPDRAKIANIVFPNPPELKFLEDITWPLVEKQVTESISRYHPGYTPAIVLDAPLLIEAGWYKMCHYILYVDVCDGDRLLNFLHRNPDASEADFWRRDALQVTVKEKKNWATHVIHNARGKWEDAQKEVEEFYLDAVAAPEPELYDHADHA